MRTRFDPSLARDQDSPSGVNERPSEQLLGQYIPLLYHHNMLQDADRVKAFRDAIDLVVQPGMHCVELGGGTGILSSFAARQGARVTCVERNPELVSCGRRFVQLNNLDEQIHVVQADASSFVPDTPADVVICEMLHVGLLREKQAQVIDAFKRNHMRAYGERLPVFLPEASILMVQPVEQTFCFFGYEAPIPVFQAPQLDHPDTRELTALHPYASIAYDEVIPRGFDVREPLDVIRPGRVNALRFVTQNVIAVDVPGQRAITWPNQCLVLPIESAFDVVADQSVQTSFRYTCGDSVERLADAIRCEHAGSGGTVRTAGAHIAD